MIRGFFEGLVSSSIILVVVMSALVMAVIGFALLGIIALCELIHEKMQ